MTRTITFDDGQPCENTTWHRNNRGYGQKQNKLHHRVVWLEHYGSDSLLSNEVIMHMCDNPSCVRLAHLTLGDNERNIADRVEKNRNRNGSSKLPKQTRLGYLL